MSSLAGIELPSPHSHKFWPPIISDRGVECPGDLCRGLAGGGGHFWSFRVININFEKCD